jgi:soluble epoxide hydrolase/lipid-phosphate phosphatase
MAHGWPSLWSTWSNQIQELKVRHLLLIYLLPINAYTQDDYHLIVPDLRGFGPSTHPDDIQSSGTMGDLVGDLVCILEHAAITSAICIGYESRFIATISFHLTFVLFFTSHDWGAQVCYEAARMRPDIFKAVVALVIPVSSLTWLQFA